MFIPVFLFTLAVALVSRSEARTIIAIVFSNVTVTCAINATPNHREYTQAFALGNINEIGFIWPAVASTAIASELLIAVAICVFIMWAITNKKEFF